MVANWVPISKQSIAAVAEQGLTQAILQGEAPTERSTSHTERTACLNCAPAL